MAARMGTPLDWDNTLVLVRALRDIAQCSPDPEAVDVATAALATVFESGAISVLFGRCCE